MGVFSTRSIGDPGWFAMALMGAIGADGVVIRICWAGVNKGPSVSINAAADIVGSDTGGGGGIEPAFISLEAAACSKLAVELRLDAVEVASLTRGWAPDSAGSMSRGSLTRECRRLC